MATKHKDNDHWLIAAGAGALGYLTYKWLKGKREGDDLETIIGKEIDGLIGLLNSHRNHDWGMVALEILKKELEHRLPPVLRLLLDIVWGVERAHIRGALDKGLRRTKAISMAKARNLRFGPA